jgi:hypothetical protein
LEGWLSCHIRQLGDLPKKNGDSIKESENVKGITWDKMGKIDKH